MKIYYCVNERMKLKKIYNMRMFYFQKKLSLILLKERYLKIFLAIIYISFKYILYLQPIYYIFMIN